MVLASSLGVSCLRFKGIEHQGFSASGVGIIIIRVKVLCISCISLCIRSRGFVHHE